MIFSHSLICDIIDLMKQLEADIKNKIYKNVYLLYGPESYDRKRYTDALVKVFLPEDDGINLTKFFGKKIDLKELFELADTMPFMADRRVIVLENTGLFSSPNEALNDFIPNIPESTVMIFSEEKADSKLKQYKAVQSNGSVARFVNLTEDELRDRVTRRLGREHRAITTGALDLFISRCGNDMWTVSNELEKIISYTFGKDGIRVEDIEAVMPARAEDRIFAMIDAILGHNKKKALAYYRDLVLLRTDPGRVLSLLRDQFRLLLHVKEMNPSASDIRKAAGILDMREGRVKMALPAARKSSKISLLQGIDMCIDTEHRIKSGLVDLTVGVESLIVELCGMDGNE